MFTQVNKIYFANTIHSNRRRTILLNYQATNGNATNGNATNGNETNNFISPLFPSFYEFLRMRSTNDNADTVKNKNNENDDNDDNNDNDDNVDNVDNVEHIKADFINFKDSIKDEIEIKNNNDDESFANILKSKNLKLLTSFSAIQWARSWVYEMVNIKELFPTFMYTDMYKMCEFGSVNVSKRYFYIGYYLPKIDQTKGPYYIGAFEVNPQEREFITRIIIQNPYYCVKNNYNKENIIDFKKELCALCVEANVFFKYSNLKNSDQERYYYSWIYEE
jgi:hypothetical protein